ncbi:MAG: M10 family metallopeptidase C-terminal domain-containing protein [Filomicrobium sp.]
MAKPTYSLDQIIDQLDSGIKWYGNTVTYSIDQVETIDALFDSSFTSLSTADQATVRLAFERWDEIIAIDLVETAGPSNISMDFYDPHWLQSPTFAGRASYSYLDFGNSTGAFLEASITIDLDGSGYSSAGSFQTGDYSFFTLIHEIGHTLGLDHPGPYNGAGVTYANDAVYSQDTIRYTVMSYFAGEADGSDTDFYHASQYWLPQTPMIHDIAAIQTIYGADTTTRTGDDVYGFGGLFDPSSSSVAPIFTIWDAGGEDTLDFSGYNTPGNTYQSTISLKEGTYSSVGGLKNNIGIAFGVEIENAKGGDATDRLTGNELDNRLEGNGSTDYLYGEGGNDTLVGGLGGDRIRGGDGDDMIFGNHDDAASVIKDYQRNLLWGEDGNDTIVAGDSNDSLFGGDGNDRLLGGSGKNYLSGGNGDDEIIGDGGDDALFGGAGADKFDGGSGVDTLYYASSTVGVTANLLTGSFHGGDADGDTITLNSIENLHGSYFRDILTGDARSNEINGRSGADRIDGGAGHDRLLGGHDNDLLIGRDGNDTIYGQNGNDRLFGINGRDFMYGGRNNDLLKGGAGNDLLNGERGNDKLFGEAGNDWITGGLGRDFLIGGAGRDRFEYSSVRESNGAVRDRIYDFTSGEDRINVSMIDASTRIAGDQRFAFIGSDSFTRTAGELRFEQFARFVRVEADVNGDGRADMQIDVFGERSLLHDDFIL